MRNDLLNAGVWARPRLPGDDHLSTAPIVVACGGPTKS
jgi:hypothetical protein